MEIYLFPFYGITAAPLFASTGLLQEFWRLSVELIIVIVLVLLLFGSFPVFPYSRDWGYRGSGILGTILMIVVILWLLKMI